MSVIGSCGHLIPPDAPLATSTRAIWSNGRPTLSYQTDCPECAARSPLSLVPSPAFGDAWLLLETLEVIEAARTLPLPERRQFAALARIMLPHGEGGLNHGVWYPPVPHIALPMLESLGATCGIWHEGVRLARTFVGPLIEHLGPSLLALTPTATSLRSGARVTVLAPDALSEWTIEDSTVVRALARAAILLKVPNSLVGGK